MKWLRKIIWLTFILYALIGVVTVGNLLLARMGVDVTGGLLRMMLGILGIVSLVGWVPLLTVGMTISLVDVTLGRMQSSRRMLQDWRVYLVTGLLALLPLLYFFVNEYIALFCIFGILVATAYVGLRGFMKVSEDDDYISQTYFGYELLIGMIIMWGMVPMIFGMYSRNMLSSVGAVVGVSVVVFVFMMRSLQLSVTRVVMMGLILIYVGWVSIDRFVLHMSWEQLSSCEEYPLYLSEGFRRWLGTSYFWYTPSGLPGVYRYEGRSEESQTQRFVVG